MKTSDLILALLTIILWSSNMIALKFGLQNTSVETLNLVRFGLCLPLLFFFKKPNISFVHLCLIALFFNVLNFWFVCRSLQHGTSVGVAAFVFQTCVFFGIVFSYIFNKEIPTVAQMLGFMISLLGVIVMSYPFISGHESMEGIVESLLSAASWGIGFALLKKYQASNNINLVVWMTGISFFLLLAFDILFGGRGMLGALHLSHQGFSASLYGLVVSSLLGCTLWFKLTKKYQASLLGSFMFLMPIFSILFSYLIFLEKISYLQMVGGMIILAGLVVSHVKSHGLRVSLNQNG